MKKIKVEIDLELYQKLKGEAEKRGISPDELAERLMAECIKEAKNEKKPR